MRVVTWNVNCFNPKRAPDKLRLLEIIPWDIALLQEVNAFTFEVFTSGTGFVGVHAVDLLGGAWDRRAHGVAVLTRGDVSVLRSALVPIEPSTSELESDEIWLRARMMSAAVDFDGVDLTIASFHSLDAASRDPDVRQRKIEQKMRLYRSFHSWCATAPAPTIVGADVNRWTDVVEPVELDTEEAFYDQRRFMNVGSDHGLRDVFIDHLLANDPATLQRRERLGAVGRDGALAVTYQRSNNNHPKVNRMDRIYASDGVAVRDVQTYYGDALSVGSDHALVVAELDLSAMAAEGTPLGAEHAA